MVSPVNLDTLSVLYLAAEDMQHYDLATANLLRHALDAGLEGRRDATETDTILLNWADQLKLGLTGPVVEMLTTAKCQHPTLADALDALVRVVPMHPDADHGTRGRTARANLGA